MNCPNCLHGKNRVRFTSVEENIRYRLRQCLDCGAMWMTEEKFDSECIICHESSWIVDNVRHDGENRKIRKRTCSTCKNVEYTIEKRTSKHFKPKEAG